jgi:AbrB family looped-hinge helix DNA binding protein
VGKVTSKLQVTVPKAIADRYRIRPGDEILWIEAGESIRVLPRGNPPQKRDPSARVRLFDEATGRQHQRNEARHGKSAPTTGDRGWTREELYERGRPR